MLGSVGIFWLEQELQVIDKSLEATEVSVPCLLPEYLVTLLGYSASADLKIQVLIACAIASVKASHHRKGDLGFNLMLRFFGSLLGVPSPRIKSSGAAKMRSS